MHAIWPKSFIRLEGDNLQDFIMGLTDGSQGGGIRLSGEIPQGLLSEVEISIEFEDGSGNVLLVVLLYPTFIYERVDSIPPSPIEGGGVEEIGIEIPL